MNNNDANISNLLEEYKVLVAEENIHGPEIDEDCLRASLVASCEWTSLGAEHLVMLVREYGSFMLRNACALSLALGVEDGEIGI